MEDTIIEYYKDKRRNENIDTAINMTLRRFWFKKNLLKSLAKYVEENEN
ncbi:hypothetical protein [Vagococcus fluvialis]|nr:hypothetical protein [Vagococcus fluvialis]UDM72631.1 hypothetical protein K5L00_14685 [Vagococcus fluvialis]UDM78354.1 hypothetical protein K5K98_14890 [Vagococcus fluvialis]UDM83906.1 hypothetical protein K5K96_14710 [Vagococcus fluvialis]